MAFSTSFISTGGVPADYGRHVPSPYFRRAFTLPALTSAFLTICGTGFYELFVNGKRITRSMLAPYDYNPDEFLFFDRYDLMPHLQVGENVIGIQLGNGTINGFNAFTWNFHRAAFRGVPRTAFSFEAMDTDGQPIVFDASSGFKWHDSPIRCDDLRAGEIYDARFEIPGWCDIGFDDSGWQDAVPAETPRGECRICNVDPIVVTKELPALSVTPASLGARPRINEKLAAIELPEEDALTEGYLYDFGMNAAGIVRLHIRNARPGQRLILQYGELTDENGNLDIRGMYFYPHRYNCRDVYICKGGEEEIWQPTFTYHGFRYCLVIGLDAEQAQPDLLTYLVSNTSLRQLSEFHCSDETVNKLWDAAIVSDLANFHHVPTDCPHREKNGWTGDMAVSAEQMVLCLSVERNLKEWLRCIRRSMNEAGDLQAIIPGNHSHYRQGPAWDAVLVQIPYQIWKYRGDTQILRDNATAIMRYLQFLTTITREDGLIERGYGDWCHAGMRSHDKYKAPVAFTATVFAMDICAKAKEIFDAVDMKPQAMFADALYTQFRTDARKQLLHLPTMTAVGNCQATQAMAIFYNLFDEAEKQEAFRKLVAMIEANDEKMDCGILGMRVIYHVLSAYGRTDLAFRMITRPDFPSFGYIIEHGATSLWESFRETDWYPDSHNHHFFGDIISWFMQNLLGLQLNPYNRSCNEVRFAPKFIDALDHANGAHRAPAGRIEASWARDAEGILYRVTLPEGMQAEIILESGWTFEDGTAWKKFSESTEFRILH
ncbi:MAG: hypothetical protein E7662_09365 [Ruminococcaceae bacterium]|nr:hypothetical protein [Oscillospiraceae bacterium]